MQRDAHVLEYLHRPWAIQERKLATIVQVVRAHVAGTVRVTACEAKREAEHRRDERAGVRDMPTIGVVPVHGVILPRETEMTDASGLTTTERIKNNIRALLAEESVKAVVLDIDSGGGLVQGVPELAKFIRESRGSKPIVAQVWDFAASAAYWIASQTDEVVVTPSGEVGSIGVIVLHSEESRARNEAGITDTILRSVPFKAEMNTLEPLTDDARKFEQQQIDAIHREFVADVAKGRGVSVAQVNESFGNGRVFRARDARSRGMVDRIATFEETVARLSKSRSGRSGRNSQARTRTLMLRRQRHTSSTAASPQG